MINWNETTNITIENELKKAQGKVIKTDKDDNNIKLEGVWFEVLDEEKNVLETIVTDENGEALTSKYPIRDFKKLYIREVQSLKDYTLNEKIVEIMLEENKINYIEFQNEKKKGKIEILKVDAENQDVKLEGVTFEILDKDGNLVDTVITDKNGIAITKRIPIDNVYTVREKETREEYVLSEKIAKVVLQEDEIKKVIFENIKKKGTIKILKISNGYNQVLNIPDKTPLSGAKFVIIDSNGNTIGIYETNENGIVQIDNIIFGEYKIYEYESPVGYLIDSIPQTVSIDKESKEVEIVFKDVPIEPELPKTGIDTDIKEIIIFVILCTVVNLFVFIIKYKKVHK